MCDPLSAAIVVGSGILDKPKIPDPPKPIPPPPPKAEKIATPKELKQEPQLLGLSALRIPMPSVSA